MKKVILITIAAFCMCSTTFAKDAFLGWKCTDVAKMKEQIAKSDDVVHPSHKVTYLLNITGIENPTAINSYDKMFAFLKEKYPALKENDIFGKIVQYKYCRGESDFTADIMKNKLAASSWYIQVYYKLVAPQRVGLSFTDEEMKSYALNLYPDLVDKNRIAKAKIALEKYLRYSFRDDDTEVVKNLKAFYRLTLQKVPDNEKWKPLIVKITLALKSRGVEIK